MLNGGMIVIRNGNNVNGVRGERKRERNLFEMRIKATIKEIIFKERTTETFKCRKIYIYKHVGKKLATLLHHLLYLSHKSTLNKQKSKCVWCGSSSSTWERNPKDKRKKVQDFCFFCFFFF